MYTVQALQDRTGSQLVGSYEERAEIQNLFTALRLLFFIIIMNNLLQIS